MKQIFDQRPLYTLERKAFLEKNDRLLYLTTLIFICALLYRSWEHFLYPGFYIEDASYYFPLNYDAEFSIKNIFRNPNGYFNVFNNFVAQLIGKIDIRYQAYAYVIVACSMCVTTVALFSRSGLVKNRFLLLVMPLAIGLSGMNHIHYYTTLTFQMYLLIITLLVVLLWEPVDKLHKNLFIMIIIALLVWSGPYSVLAVPFAIGFLLIFRGKSLIMVWTIVVTIVYVLTTTGSVGSGIAPGHLLSGFFQTLWAKTILFDVIFMGFRGGNLNIEKIVLVAAILTPAIYLIRRDTVQLRILLLLVIIIVATPAPLLLTYKYMLYKGIFPCHILTAQVAWILFILILLDRLIEKIKERYQSTAGIIVMTTIALFVIADNLKHPRKGQHVISYNAREFLQTIKEYEDLALKEKNKNVIISTDGMGRFNPRIKVGSKRTDAVTIEEIHIPQYERK